MIGRGRNRAGIVPYSLRVVPVRVTSDNTGSRAGLRQHKRRDVAHLAHLAGLKRWDSDVIHALDRRKNRDGRDRMPFSAPRVVE
jgi:hypothetical protein